MLSSRPWKLMGDAKMVWCVCVCVCVCVCEREKRVTDECALLTLCLSLIISRSCLFPLSSSFVIWFSGSFPHLSIVSLFHRILLWSFNPFVGSPISCSPVISPLISYYTSMPWYLITISYLGGGFPSTLEYPTILILLSLLLFFSKPVFCSFLFGMGVTRYGGKEG